MFSINSRNEFLLIVLMILLFVYMVCYRKTTSMRLLYL